jgi:hypothetical protein
MDPKLQIHYDAKVVFLGAGGANFFGSSSGDTQDSCHLPAVTTRSIQGFCVSGFVYNVWQLLEGDHSSLSQAHHPATRILSKESSANQRNTAKST